ncbi:MAG TPA: PEGA domain-containing protein, partial [Terriglobales bacterium]|nr:PEGA domain-containing protein [Terriglobales bacterium]
LFDKEKVRIGEGWISLSNVAAGEIVKFETTLRASGNPVSLALSPRSLPAELASYLPARLVSVTVNSIPQGASLTVDGKDSGTTPKLIQVGTGHHVLGFKKEGFNSGQFPLDITNDDASGGSVSYELGTAAHDTLELRDGTVLTGDIESMSATEILVHSGGTTQHLNRNLVGRILLVQRETPSQ